MTELARFRREALFIVFAAAALVSGAARAALDPTIPVRLPSGAEPEGVVRALLKHEPWVLSAELYDSWQTDGRNERSVMLGTYYRLLDNLKVGAFYLAEEGVRHDEDWVKGPDDIWGWANTNSRLENVLVLDASPRLELGFLPGRNWVGELKARYFYDFFDSQQMLTLRPGLTYFWLRDGQPFLNFFLQYEMWFPLGFGQKTLYETWAYLGALYHLADQVQLGGYGALKQQFWSSTPAYTQETGNSYVVEGDSTVIGLLAVFQFGI
jgi:hypothetical protein